MSGTLFFAATDEVNVRTLWKSDGTATGTMRVLPTSGDIAPLSLTDVDGTLFFTADDGSSGRELWKSDGTAAGTVLVKDGVAGSLSSFPDLLTNVNGMLFYVADDDAPTGRELWKSGGTAASTLPVKDIFPGTFGSYPEDLTNVNGTLFFSAEDPLRGRELWKSDGTEAGTVLVADINAGSSFPNGLAAGGPGLFFTAEDALVGRELCALGLPVVTNNDGVALVATGQVVTYSIEVSNPGPPDMFGVVSDVFPAELEGVTWTCTSAVPGSCTAVGAGAISDAVHVRGGTSVTYVATGSVSLTASGLLTNTAAVTLQPNSLSYAATDVDVVGAPMDYFTLTPCRLVDTRGVGGSMGGPALQGLETRVYTARSRCGIPATARAVAVNVTATRSSAAGNVRIFPAGQALPVVSTVNYGSGQTRGSNAIVTLNANGEFSAYAKQDSGTTVDLVIDVAGYFE